MCAQKIESFDMSPKQRAILEWKQVRRAQLRHKYLKEILNPSLQVMPMDSAVQRLIALRHNHHYVSHVKFVPHILGGLLWLASFYYGSRFLMYIKGRDEKLFCTGQVAYVDREHKFV